MKYLSPSSLAKWHYNQEEFYLQYLAKHRPPRFKQTQPMSIGSAFDAYVKAYFHEVLKIKGPNFEELFESQVEEHNRDWAREHGKVAFDQYKTSGALADLLSDLLKSEGQPRFEFTIEKTIDGVNLLGKPDAWFTVAGTNIILDWKVNGYCSQASPKRGFIRCRDGWTGAQSRTHNQSHKDCTPMRVNGVLININEHLETINSDWSQQLATYAWLMGAEVGESFICAIDQLACAPGPKIRVAEHRCTISGEYQHTLLNKYKELWDIVHSDHIFRDRSLEESQERCATLDKQFEAYLNQDDVMKELMGR